MEGPENDRAPEGPVGGARFMLDSAFRGPVGGSRGGGGESRLLDGERSGDRLRIPGDGSGGTYAARLGWTGGGEERLEVATESLPDLCPAW